MDNPKNPLAMLAYFILGLIVLVVAVRVIWWLIGVAVAVVWLAVSVAIVIVVGYVVYHLLKAACRSG